MKKVLIGVVIGLFVLAAPAFAQPKFPPLTGRVVDNADILSPRTEQALTGRLADLEASTGRQLVVATLKDLQGYEIEEYGYRLGRTWGIGSAEDDDGALFLIAPNERQVRIEVGYGLEPVLTDALSSIILQREVLPRFRAGDMEEGVVAGTEAIIAQLQLPEEEAQALAAQAAERAEAGAGDAFPILGIVPLIGLFIFLSILNGFRRRRRRRSGLADALPWLILGALSNSGRDSGWSSRGGGWSSGSWGGGGGGFSGGGGSFGGGGASGRW